MCSLGAGWKKLHAKLSSDKKRLKVMFKQVFKQNMRRWKMKEANEKKFAEKMQIRLRTIFYQYMRGERNGAAWAAAMMNEDADDGDEDSDEDGDEDAEEEEKGSDSSAEAEGEAEPDSSSRHSFSQEARTKPAGAEEFYYGWNGELQCAYRRPTTGHAKGLEEMAISVEKNPPPCDAEDLDMYKAKWENGDEHVVSKTNGEIKALIKTLTRSAISRNDVFWTGTNPETKHKLELKEKIDKNTFARYLRAGQVLVRNKRIGVLRGGHADRLDQRNSDEGGRAP